MARAKILLAVLLVGSLCGLGAWWFVRWQPPSGAMGPGASSTQGRVAAAAYVGSAACATCHEEEQRLWQGSHHDLAMQPATESTVLGDFGGVDFEYASTVSRFYRDRGRFMVRTDGPDGALHDYEVRYTFGAVPLQQYLIEFPGGRLQALGIAWDARAKEQGGQRWFHLYPGERVTHDDELHWTRWTQNWNLQCAECHSTDLRKNYDAKTRSYQTAWAEMDVACEACHGPGSRHLAWAEGAGSAGDAEATKGLDIRFDERRGVGWPLDPQTGKPRRSTPRRTEKEIQLCARCHSRRGVISEDYHYGRPLLDTHLPALLSAGLYHADGQIEAEVYEHGSFLQSRMASAGVTCSDCHDPHTLQLKAPGDGVCMQCHQADRYDSPQHHFHRAGSAGASCIECHMPAQEYMVIDPRRDHSFRVPRPDLSVQLGTPNACTRCHTDKGDPWAAAQVRLWYKRDAAGYQHYAEALHAARSSAVDAEVRLVALLRDLEQPAMARATAAAELGRWLSPASLASLAGALGDADPQVRMGAIQALESVPPEQRWSMAGRLLDDPVRGVRLLAAGALAEGSNTRSAPERADFDRAAAEYIAAQELNSDQPGPLVNLGNFHLARGETERAERAYREAIELDSGWVPAYVNLADMCRQAGRDADGEAVLRAGLARLPQAAALHHSLGLLLVRAKKMSAALEALQRASDLAPEDTRFAYVYAVGLADTGRRLEALAVVETTLQRAPGDRLLRQLRTQLAASSQRP